MRHLINFFRGPENYDRAHLDRLRCLDGLRFKRLRIWLNDWLMRWISLFCGLRGFVIPGVAGNRSECLLTFLGVDPLERISRGRLYLRDLNTLGEKTLDRI